MRPSLARANAAQILAHRVAMPGHSLPFRAWPHGHSVTRGDGRLRALTAHATAAGNDDVVGIRQQRVEQLDLEPDEAVDARLFGGGHEADRAVQAVMIGHRDAGQPELARTLHEVVRRRCAVQEREVRMAVKLRVRHRSILEQTF
jgi:hypothetical protein